jgi:hypothetical protein
MPISSIFELCQPREDVREGRVRDQEFAADVAAVVSPDPDPALRDYTEPARFFGHTYPTRNLRVLLEAVCRRLSGAGGEVSPLIRLDTQFGGGKTHNLIALVHAVNGMHNVENVGEFVDPTVLPNDDVRVAVLDGQTADPANGLEMEPGLRVRTFWGEMAYRLGGREAYELVRRSDETQTAPGDQTLVRVFGNQPCLILIDEIAVYLRKVAKDAPSAAGQFTAFIQALLKAVASTPRVALVYTLAVRTEDGEARDAYRAENQQAAAAFEEASSVVSRNSTQLNPTEDDETAAVLRRRLFGRIDDDGVPAVIDAYQDVWKRNRDQMPAEAFSPETRDQFLRGYPLHPETLNTLVEKTSSLSTFQRTRGMLRLLARTVHHLWNDQSAAGPVHAIHPHHIDPGYGPIREEFSTRLQQGQYASALSADVAAVAGKDPATAQRLDQLHHAGQPPVTAFVARTVYLHTLAHGDAAQGIKPDQLRYSVCSPEVEPAFVELARSRFVTESLYLDDRPGAPLRFQTEANLTQMVNRAMSDVAPEEVRSFLNERVRDLYSSKQGFELVPFPSAPFEVPDEVGDGRPFLCVLGYEAYDVSDEPTSLPGDVARMFETKGTQEQPRLFKNNLAFLVADRRYRDDMKVQVRRKLGLQLLSGPRGQNLVEHQRQKVEADLKGTDFHINQAVLQCYRHIFYPSHIAVGQGRVQLGHTAIELAGVSSDPRNGQTHVKRALRDQKKLLDAHDEPDAPNYVKGLTPLKTKGQLSTLDLRNEYRRNPRLSMLLDDGPLRDCVRKGIESGIFVYQSGSMLCGQGDPMCEIRLSDDAFVYTTEKANEVGIWPRKPKEPEPTPDPEPAGAGAVGNAVANVDGRGGASSGATSTGASPTNPTGAPPTPAPAPELSAEGPLSQALAEVFEKARGAKISRLGRITVRLFEPTPAWSVHVAAATYRDATVTSQFAVELSAPGIKSLAIEFDGELTKANPVKSFIDTQLRMADDRNFDAHYTFEFSKALDTAAASAEGFIKALTKQGAGAAYVEAEAAGESESSEGTPS